MSSFLVLKATGVETLQMGGFQDQQVPLSNSRVSEPRSRSAADPKSVHLAEQICSHFYTNLFIKENKDECLSSFLLQNLQISSRRPADDRKRKLIKSELALDTEGRRREGGQKQGDTIMSDHESHKPLSSMTAKPSS